MIYLLNIFLIVWVAIAAINLALMIFAALKLEAHVFVMLYPTLVGYSILSMLNWPLTLFAWLVAPVIPLFASNDGWLPKGLSWFQTPDNSLHGDSGWITQHWQWRYSLPIGMCNYIGMVGWLIRNPAYGFGLEKLYGPLYANFIGDNTIRDNANAKAGWLLVTCDDLFQLTWIVPIGFSRCFMLNLGWNIRALVDPHVSPVDTYEATFVFSPRISGYL